MFWITYFAYWWPQEVTGDRLFMAHFFCLGHTTNRAVLFVIERLTSICQFDAIFFAICTYLRRHLRRLIVSCAGLAVAFARVTGQREHTDELLVWQSFRFYVLLLLIHIVVSQPRAYQALASVMITATSATGYLGVDLFGVGLTNVSR